MNEIPYIDRLTGTLEHEKIFGGKALRYLYSQSTLAKLLCGFISKNSFISRLYGMWQKCPWTARSVNPFIKKYDVDSTEFEEQSFKSFNDFFIRTLKKSARPISTSLAVIPADARYWFYPHLDTRKPLLIKGQSFDLSQFLGDKELANRFAGGSALLARLCPTDYHRFHFPCDCIPGKAKLINGPLFSVNPIATWQNVAFFTENKRKVTLLESEDFGTIAYVEIGATNVGSIVETYTPFKKAFKGSEKGYFEFGGSALALFFLPGKITFAEDLVKAGDTGLEIRCLMGQPLAKI
jgi:phosphatidylserine decarboxylase